ncbi:hypothetical protein CAPTEDRAFT_218535 [Capitella teleta]|uniref:Mutator-like transposase domain-containing protein n=1 Tax=Capitella teleta TaxID=283909 RepID=R7UDQ4_CAPTE|nr:hypothetical protein CAPTEDRAFT_218535 [Capitella teleta]|eukprot:ELU04515.1 hypothetical protein CAPTEDRAFT_218535 [Capitella teleta]
MKAIFGRSRVERKLDYVNYLGDGDSKAFAAVRDAAPYPVNKLECCGHVQKRMGKRLMDKVSQLKSTSFKHAGKSVKGIGGAGKLTQKAIKRIQGHYGGAIRAHPGDLDGMKKAVWAIWHHRGDRHQDCGEWCPAKQGKPVKNCLPEYVLTAIKPVFEALSSDELLNKCLHGGSQNTNESFHNLIWERCPKTTFVGRRRLELATYEAAIVYNGGETARLKVVHALGFKPGDHAYQGATVLDRKRMKGSFAAGDLVHIERRHQRALGAEPDDSHYSAGAF